MDTGKARRELGWKPRFDAAETLIQTAVSAREAGLLAWPSGRSGDDRQGAGVEPQPISVRSPM